MNKDLRLEAEEQEIMSINELANLGEGEFAYITEISSAEAGRLFAAIDGLPEDAMLYSLNAADGTPLALTDTLSAARAQAFEEDLELATVH